MCATGNVRLLTLFHNRHDLKTHLNHIHSLLITSGLSQDTIFFSNLSQSHNLTYLWNTIIRAFSTTSHPHFSLLSYAKMRQFNVLPDHHTFPLLLKSFSILKNENPFQFYAHVVKFGLGADHFVSNSFISAFANCGYLDFAHKVFGESTMNNDVISWTALIDGYVRNGHAVEGLKCFLEMRSKGVRADEVTVVSALCAAGMVGDVWFGRWVHGFYIESRRVHWDVYVGSALVDMYSKCGCCDDARNVFDAMPSRNVVSWSALIAGYVQCNRYTDALLLFQSMLIEDVKPNQSTLTSVLTACAQLGALDQGRWVHGFIDRNKFSMNLMLGTALIDMYAKCGCLEKALLVFDKMPVKNVYSWTAIINGLAVHGDALRSLNVFSSMLRNGIRPNKVTFIAVLSACSHGGLVNEGQKFFDLMRHSYHLEPNVGHYGCMVDLLGRAGYLKEAMKLIEDMPMEPTPGVWGALFGACMIHKNFELGEHIGHHLIKLQPNHSGRYSLLANLYSACQNWEAAAHVRKLMKGKEMGKTSGCSWIEVNAVIHDFIAFDKSHPESNDVYEMLDNVMVQLKLSGYIPDINLVTFDIDGIDINYLSAC